MTYFQSEYIIRKGKNTQKLGEGNKQFNGRRGGKKAIMQNLKRTQTEVNTRNHMESLSAAKQKVSRKECGYKVNSGGGGGGVWS